MMWFFACAEPPAPQPVEAPAPAEVPAPVEPPAPTFEATTVPLPSDLRAAMTGVTWEEGCPVGLDALSLVTVTHWDLNDTVQTGQLVVATEHAALITDVLRKAFEAHYPIERMEPVHRYDGDDDRSMAANNTSAFNCRQTTSGTRYSEHSWGHAIDINPLRNPYVTGSGRVYPPEGADYVDRTRDFPGKIDADGVLVQAFDAHGWGWGGRWSSSKDYQHFSATGR